MELTIDLFVSHYRAQFSWVRLPACWARVKRVLERERGDDAVEEICVGARKRPFKIDECLCQFSICCVFTNLLKHYQFILSRNVLYLSLVEKTTQNRLMNVLDFVYFIIPKYITTYWSTWIFCAIDSLNKGNLSIFHSPNSSEERKTRREWFKSERATKIHFFAYQVSKKAAASIIVFIFIE